MSAIHTISFDLSRIRTLLGAVGALLAGIAFAILGLVLITTQVFDYQMLAVRSDSMIPTFSRGDLIVSRPVPAEDIDVNDIILFRVGGQMPVNVTHRVSAVINFTTNITNRTTGEVTQQHSRAFRTKGDANPSEDGGIVDATHLIGKVWFTVPRVGGVLIDWQMRQVLIGIAGLSLVCWLGYEVAGLRQRRRDSGNTE